VSLLAAALVLALAPGPTGPQPPEAPADRDLRLVKPALVRIESHAKATISVATIRFDEGALEAFVHRDVANLLASGRRFPSEAAAEQALTSDLEHEFVANPAPYLELGDRVTDPYDTARVGSGWLADGEGTVVTAADVLLDEPAVTAAATEEERQAITADLDDVTPADLGLTVPLSDPQKASIVNAALARAVPSIQVSGISSQTTVQLGSAVPGQQSGAGVRPDVRIAVSHRDPHGTGLAVLQVHGRQFASIPLAYGSTLAPGAGVAVAGYPAAEATSGGAPDTGPVAPEVVAGTIRDAAPDGPALTDAGYTAGVIGGAVLNAEGKAVGVAVKRDGASAVVPVADVARVLDEARARGRTNVVTVDYRKAAADMSRRWYKRALPILQSIGRRAPDMPWISDQAQEAAREIALGHDDSPSDRPFLPVAVAAVLFAADAMAVTTVLRRRFLASSRSLGG
jgi:hypothetical protein